MPPYGAPASAVNSTFNLAQNGDMQIAQISAVNTAKPGGLSLTGSGQEYVNIDGLALEWVLGGNIVQPSFVQDADHPLLGSDGFSSLYSGGNLTPGAGTGFYIAQTIPFEMNNLLKLIGLSPLYLSFYVLSTQTGNHYCALYNGSGGVHSDRSYVMRYNVQTANAWQKIVLPVSFPASLTYPATLTDLAMTLVFPMIADTTTFLATTFNAWNGNPNAMVGADFQQINVAESFQVTDVKIGFDANYQRRSFQEALIDAQRYYQQTFPYGVYPGAVAAANRLGALVYKPDVGGVNTSGMFRSLAPTMRMEPTVTGYNVADGTATWRNNTAAANSGAFSGVNIGANGFYAQNLQVAGDNSGDEIMIHTSMDARL